MQAAHTDLGAGRAAEQPIVSASEHRNKRFPVVAKEGESGLYSGGDIRPHRGKNSGKAGYNSNKYLEI